MGNAGNWISHGNGQGPQISKGDILMPVQGDYMGMMLTIEDLDQENQIFSDTAQRETSDFRKVKRAAS